MNLEEPSNHSTGDLENTHEGHRERLRQRFQSKPESLSDQELLELLLAYAIPRKDVAPIAEQLIAQFGDIDAIISSTSEQLKQVPGIGQYTAIFFRIIDEIMNRSKKTSPDQPMLISLEDQNEVIEKEVSKPVKAVQSVERKMRVYANDEVENSLAFLPKASQFSSLDAFRSFLIENLPYNSIETRQRNSNYILNRFYIGQSLDTPLTTFTSLATEEGKKAAIFYHLAKAEPILTKVADELIYPNLPIGRVTREQLREFTLRYLPDSSMSSQKNMLRSLLYTYQLLGVGTVANEVIRFHLHSGSLDGLVYVLTSEFSEPGIYSFDMLNNSPAHRWLLWDKEWVRKQLYRLQDLGILAKVSEIDTVRQFTISMTQEEALDAFFSQVTKKPSILREASEESYPADDSGLGG